MTRQHISVAKLMPPALHPGTVPRGEACARICRSAAPLTVIHAAAGWGKSTLMAQCRAALAEQGVLTLWLTLDRADNDAPRLLRTLAHAAEALMDEPPESVGELLQGFAGAPGPWALCLDEAEHLSAPASLSLLRELCERLPRNGRVIIASRQAPDVGLQAWRARGQLLELDERALRFQLDEAAQLLGLPDAPPPAAWLKQLHERTEGWPLALAMLARSGAQAWQAGAVSGDLLAGLSGSEQEVAQYLGEEVLARQTPALRDFLLRTSVLQHLEPGLCQALNPRLDGAQVLVWLADARIFVTPLDGEVPAWRYHRMFAECLRARLARDQPGEAQRLHLLAAGWYEAQGRLAPAIDHAIEGEDWPLAVALLARAAPDFLEQGRFQLLGRWLGLLPPDAMSSHPLLQVSQVWALCLTQGAEVARQAIGRHQLAACTDPQVQAHLRALMPMLLALQDQYAQACDAGELALSQAPSGQAFVDGVLGNVVAHVSFVMGRHTVATRLLAQVHAPGAFERMYRESTLGMMELREGRLRQAAARFRLALDQVGKHPGHGPGNAWLGVLYAYTRFEAGELDEAEQLLQLYLPPARDIGLPDHMIGSYVMRSRMAHARGDLDGALQHLCELEHDGMHRQLPRVAASANLERARLLLQGQAGQLDAAEQALRRAAELYPWDRVSALALPAHETDDLTMVRIRAHMAAGEDDVAEALIASELGAAQARPRRRLKLTVLRALLGWQQGDADAAAALLRPVLHTCSQEGYVRLVVDEGPAMLPLLRRCHADIRNGPRAERDPVLQDHVERLIAALGQAGGSTGMPPADALTQKETLVLRLLSEGCSNQAISAQLLISDSTVRTHLRSINQKLGAQSRAQAVAHARRLMLID